MNQRFNVPSLLLAAVLVLSGLLVLQPAGLVAQAPAGSVAPGAIEPVAVNLADVAGSTWRAPGASRVASQPSRASDAELAAFREAAAGLPASDRIQLIEASPDAPVPGTSFDSLDFTECCGGGGLVPPDPDLSAGPNHLIAVVNAAFEIYDKTGATLVPPTTFDAFMATVPDCLGGFDPTTVYDEEVDRFVLGVDGGGDHFCAAVSQTSDPTGAWWIYAVPADYSGAFHDYPHMGIGEDAIFVGANQFGGSLPNGFEGRVWALDKTAMYAGSPFTPISFSTGDIEGTPQPLHLHGYNQGTWPNTGTHHFITDPYDGIHLTVWEWPNPLTGGVPAIAAVFDLVAETGVPGGFPVEVPQLGGVNIEANDWRMRGLEYRNGHAWTTDSISCDPGSGTVDCVRWTEIDLTSNPPSLVQAGVFASDGEFRTFPDIAANQCNDMAVGYTKSNSAMYPGVWVTGRQSTDPMGTVQPEIQLKAGETTYYAYDGAPLRWGDYTGMTIDPDGQTFWYLGEYSKDIQPPQSANWGNFVGSYTYPDCGAELPTRFRVRMTGAQEVPPVNTDARGRAKLDFVEAGTPRVKFLLQARDTGTVTAAHIHCAPVGVNGPAGVTLYLAPPGGQEAGADMWFELTRGIFTAPDGGNGCGWTTLDDVVTAMRSGDTYVNYHTVDYPAGEVRGQIEPIAP